MTYSFQNLTTPKNVASGVAQVLLYAPISDFTSIAVPTAPFANPGDSITITGDHTFAAGKGFKTLALAPQHNSLDSKPRGDVGLNGLGQEAKIFIPGSYVELHENMAEMLNTPMIVLIEDVEELGSGTFYQLGINGLAAYTSGPFTTGTSKDGKKGYENNIICDHPITYYKGTVTNV